VGGGAEGGGELVAEEDDNLGCFVFCFCVLSIEEKQIYKDIK
jgi:hypothetical protein